MNSVLPEAHGTFYEIHRMRVEVPNWLGKKNENTFKDHPTPLLCFWDGR